MTEVKQLDQQMDWEELFTADDHEDGAWCELTSPINGEKTGLKVKVKGYDSKTYRQANRKMKRGIIEAIRGGKEADEDEYSLIIECTIDWNFTSKGEPVPFNKNNVRALYEKSPGVAQQVDSFILNRRNFTKG